MAEIITAVSSEEFMAGRQLILEYAAGLNIDLCFQNFDRELETLEQQYGLPSGCLLLLKKDETWAGCLGLRKFSDYSVELKRMYIRKPHRRNGFSQLLLDEAIRFARKRGYPQLVLDTLPSMTGAIALYEKNGFKDIAPYTINPVRGARYMGLEIEANKDA